MVFASNPFYKCLQCSVVILELSYLLFILFLSQKPVDIVIGADTVIIYENEIIEKPKDKEDAFRMLNRSI